jgi:micrococcal nuclease
VLPPDPYDFDADNDGMGCESSVSNCDASYPDNCIPPPPPDLNCNDVGVTNFAVNGSDPHELDPDNDGMGYEDGM